MQGLADGGLPDLLCCGSIDGNQAAVACAHINFSIPDGHASISARRVRAVQRLVEPDLGIVLPEEFSRGCFHGVNLGERGADVNNAIHNNRLGDNAHCAVIIQIPGEAQIAGVLIVNLFERAEMFRIVGAAVHQPVVPGGGIGHDARLVHVAGLRRAIRRRAQRNGNSDRDNDQCQTQNAPCFHARPPFE